MKTYKHLRPFALMIFAIILAFSLAACQSSTQSSPPPTAASPAPSDAGGQTEDSEFVFTGKGTADSGRELNYVITGNKDGTLLVTIEELPRLSMDGTWILEANKGYKLYLNDGNGTYAYTKFDDGTKTFNVETMIATGNYGAPIVNFTYVDEDFVYDGEGLGRKPPLFNIWGYNGGSFFQEGVVTCGEDGTFVVASNGGTWWVYDRNQGTWTYNEELDQYELTFSEPYRFANRDAMRNGEPGASCRVFTGEGEWDELTYEQYVEENYWVGPYIATHSTTEDGQDSYDLTIALDFGSDEICMYYGSAVYDD